MQLFARLYDSIDSTTSTNGTDGTWTSVGTATVPTAAPQIGINAARHSADLDASESGGAAIYNTAQPVQALANMESMTLDAVYILKDFHRHLEDPVVVRRLRNVG